MLTLTAKIRKKVKNISTNLGGFEAQALQHKQSLANVKCFLLRAGFSKMISIESLSTVSRGQCHRHHF